MNETAYRQYLEDAGDMMEAHGLPHTAGRVVGALLVCVPPERTLNELAEDLQASKGSISMSTQMLIRLGLIERISLPGERRRHYRMKRDVWKDFFSDRTDHLLGHVQLTSRGLVLLEDESIEMKQRLLEFQAYIDFVREELPRIQERWKTRRTELVRQWNEKLKEEEAQG